MKKLNPSRVSLRYLVYYELLDVLGLIITDVIIFLLVDMRLFLYGQIYMIPVLLYNLFALHKKQLIEIVIDEEAKTITFKINSLIYWNKLYCIPFSDLTLIHLHKWFFKTYLDVMQLNAYHKKLAVLPYKQSVWNKAELDDLVVVLRKNVEYIDLRRDMKRESALDM